MCGTTVHEQSAADRAHRPILPFVCLPQGCQNTASLLCARHVLRLRCPHDHVGQMATQMCPNPCAAAAVFCAPGYGWSAGLECTLCPANSYSPGGTCAAPKPPCTPCPAGTAAPSPGSTNCSGAQLPLESTQCGGVLVACWSAAARGAL
jgi:hypothetical protein